ncbi:MAG: stalk domain-containing protein, partial [Oscillospiraceae bacterium]|nr:stalk domain-containing protein [Oscillospiraceae bacterium]
MSKIKKLTALFLITAMMLTCCVFSVSAASAITLEIDGNIVTPAVAPVVESGTTFVPLKVVFQTLGATVAWSDALKQVTVTTAAYTVVFTINSKTYTVNGSSKTLDVAPKIIKDSTMIPISAFSGTIGADASYDAAANKVTVKYFTKGTSGSISMSGSSALYPLAQMAADQFKSLNPKISMNVAAGGSGTGLNNVLSKTVDIGNSDVYAAEKLTADDAKTLVDHKVCLIGVALIVNADVGATVKNLTKAQL